MIESKPFNPDDWIPGEDYDVMLNQMRNIRIKNTFDSCNWEPYRKNLMRDSEKIAYEYLLSLGFEEENILFNTHDSPDFLTTKIRKRNYSVSGWEVKNSNHISFTYNQLNSMDYDTKIVIVDVKENRVKEVKYFYDFLITNYLRNDCSDGMRTISISGELFTGFFEEIHNAKFLKNYICENNSPITMKSFDNTFGLREKVENLKEAEKNVSIYFNSISERENMISKLKELCWWI